VCTNGVVRNGLVAEGRLLTIIAESAFRFAGWNMTIKALPINLPEAHRSVTVVIVTLKNRTLTPTAQLFIDCAREVAKRLAASKSASARRL
jgi:hypothetical protein